MKILCKKFTAGGNYISSVILDTSYDLVDGIKILDTVDALEYCKKYLTSDRDISKGTYFICYKGINI